MLSRFLALSLAYVVLLSVTVTSIRADEIDAELAIVAQAGSQGTGSRAASVACERLSARGTDVVPRLLVAMDTDNPVAANWYRTAYETIVEHELAKAEPRFPLKELQAFVRDAKRAGRVRRLALEVCDKLETDWSRNLIPRLLEDPEFRSDAVEAALVTGQQVLENGDSEAARDEFQKAFQHARDPAQTVRAAGKLAGLGDKVDITQHLGLVVDWWLVGPFDAPRFSGFAREFRPELQVDLQAQYLGQEGRPIAWHRHHAAGPLGELNLIQAVGPASEAVAFAYAELVSPQEKAAQLRCGADDNCTVWLNGDKVFSREQWLNGSRFDRFVSPVQIRRGENRLLVKVCQGPQHKDPQVSNNWTLQLRFCDESGGGLRLESRAAEVSQAAK